MSDRGRAVTLTVPWTRGDVPPRRRARRSRPARCSASWARTAPGKTTLLRRSRACSGSSAGASRSTASPRRRRRRRVRPARAAPGRRGVPGLPAVPAPERPRQRRVRRRAAQGVQSHGGRAPTPTAGSTRLGLAELGRAASRRQLSGGQAQRVALARALASRAARCCCSTSRSRRSTRGPGSRCARELRRHLADFAGPDPARHARPARGDGAGRPAARARERPDRAGGQTRRGGAAAGDGVRRPPGRAQPLCGAARTGRGGARRRWHALRRSRAGRRGSRRPGAARAATVGHHRCTPKSRCTPAHATSGRAGSPGSNC